jgi:hypothetical protein
VDSEWRVKKETKTGVVFLVLFGTKQVMLATQETIGRHWTRGMPEL